jgi:hypothetical protein
MLPAGALIFELREAGPGIRNAYVIPHFVTRVWANFARLGNPRADSHFAYR